MANINSNVSVRDKFMYYFIVYLSPVIGVAGGGGEGGCMWIMCLTATKIKIYDCHIHITYFNNSLVGV